MTGINEVKLLVKENRNKGIVVAKGKLLSDDLTQYIIVELSEDKGLITQYFYDSDLKLGEDVKLGDSVKLEILDDYTGIWKKI